MPDPSASDALLEAYALAPADDDIMHTIEMRHPSFIDEFGALDSVWAVLDQREFVGTIEASAPVKGGQEITFQPMAFRFALANIEAGATPEIEISIDGVSGIIAEQLDRAIVDASPITMVYRPYLRSDPSTPQQQPPHSFTLSEVTVSILTVRAKARTGIDLRLAFPRRIYSAREFPGLIGS